MKNLLKLGQGPRPDLLFEEEEKAKKSDTQPDGQKQKIEFEKGLRTVRKEAKKKAREEKKKQEPIEMSRKDKLAVILAYKLEQSGMTLEEAENRLKEGYNG